MNYKNNSNDTLNSKKSGGKPKSLLNNYESLNISKNSSAEEIAEKYLRSKLSLDFKNVSKPSYNTNGTSNNDFYENKNVINKSNYNKFPNDKLNCMNNANNNYSMHERKGHLNYDNNINDVSIFSHAIKTNSSSSNVHLKYGNCQNDEKRMYTNLILNSNNMTNFASSTNSTSVTDFKHFVKIKEDKKGNYCVKNGFSNYDQGNINQVHIEDRDRGIDMTSIDELLNKYDSINDLGGKNSSIRYGGNPKQLHHRYSTNNKTLLHQQNGRDNSLSRAKFRTSIVSKTEVTHSSSNNNDGHQYNMEDSNKFYYNSRMSKHFGDNTQCNSKKKNLIQRNKDYVHYLSNRNSMLKNELSIRKDLRKKPSVLTKLENTNLKCKMKMDGYRNSALFNSSFYRDQQNKYNNETELISSINIFNNNSVNISKNENSYIRNFQSENQELSGRNHESGNYFTINRSSNADNTGCSVFDSSFLKSTYSDSSKIIDSPLNYAQEGGHANGADNNLHSIRHNDNNIVNDDVSNNVNNVSNNVNNVSNNVNNVHDNTNLGASLNANLSEISISQMKKKPNIEPLTNNAHISNYHLNKGTSLNYSDLRNKPEIYNTMYNESNADKMRLRDGVSNEEESKMNNPYTSTLEREYARNLLQNERMGEDGMGWMNTYLKNQKMDITRLSTTRGKDSEEYKNAEGKYYDLVNKSIYQKKHMPRGNNLSLQGENISVRNGYNNSRNSNSMGIVKCQGREEEKILGYTQKSIEKDGEIMINKENGMKNFPLPPLYFSENKLSNIFKNKIENNNLLSNNINMDGKDKRKGSSQNCSSKRSEQKKPTKWYMMNSNVNIGECDSNVMQKEKNNQNELNSINNYEDYCKYITESINGIPITIKNMNILLALALYFLNFTINNNSIGNEISDKVLIKLMNKFLYCLNLKTCLLKENKNEKNYESNKYYYIQIRHNDENVELEKQKEGEEIKEGDSDCAASKNNISHSPPDAQNKKINTLSENTNPVNFFTFYNKRIVLKKSNQTDSVEMNIVEGLPPNKSHYGNDNNYKKKCFYLDENMKIITLVDIYKIAWCLCVLKKNMKYIDLLRILYKEVEHMNVSKELIFCVSYIFKYCNIIEFEECKTYLNKNIMISLEDNNNENLCMYLHLLHVCSIHDRNFLNNSHKKNIDQIVTYFYDKIENLNLYVCTNILCVLANLNVKNNDYPYFFNKMLNYFRSNIKKLNKSVILVNVLWSLCIIEVLCSEFLKDLSEYIINILHIIPLSEFITISCSFSCQKVIIIKSYFENVKKTKEEHLSGNAVSNTTEYEYKKYESVASEYYENRKMFPYYFYRRPMCHSLIFKILAYNFLHYEQKQGGRSSKMDRDQTQFYTSPPPDDHKNHNDNSHFPENDNLKRKSCRSLSVENNKGSTSNWKDTNVHNSRFNSSNIYRNVKGTDINSANIGDMNENGLSKNVPFETRKQWDNAKVDLRMNAQKNKYPKKYNEKRKIKEYYNLHERNNNYEFSLNSCERILFANLIEDCCNNFESLNCVHLIELLFTLCILNLDRTKIVKLVEKKIDYNIFKEIYENVVLKKKKHIHKNYTEEEIKNERNDLIILNYIYNKYVQENYLSLKNDTDVGFFLIADNIHFSKYINDDSFLKAIKANKGVEKIGTSAFYKLRNILNAATTTSKEKEFHTRENPKDSRSKDKHNDTINELKTETREGQYKEHFAKNYTNYQNMQHLNGDEKNLGMNVVRDSHHRYVLGNTVEESVYLTDGKKSGESCLLSKDKNFPRDKQCSDGNIKIDEYNMSNKEAKVFFSKPDEDHHNIISTRFGSNCKISEKTIDQENELPSQSKRIQIRQGGRRTEGSEYAYNDIEETSKQLNKFKTDLKNTYDVAIAYYEKRTKQNGVEQRMNNNLSTEKEILVNAYNKQKEEQILNPEIYHNIITKRNIKNILHTHHTQNEISEKNMLSFSSIHKSAHYEKTKDAYKFNFYKTFILLLQLSAISLLSFVIIFVYTSLT
ncbi:hypothetical protein, conserved [Plasmodium gonderi]|uniref:Uncharacterized protein n=1 Tax=Plasmodium gonderi TaxID=77519 RepID=A0A1Y1JM62_PLAGO|nr:hypothetical protein, conserved [Plasmodium gonderi]GAW82297.1 hypothetical protein, conserved [Plasmodium gonderi]